MVPLRLSVEPLFSTVRRRRNGSRRLTKGTPMTRFKLLLALVATTLSFAAATAQANESEWFSHATVCVPATSGATAPTYNQYGVNNISSAAALLVECPLI